MGLSLGRSPAVQYLVELFEWCNCGEYEPVAPMELMEPMEPIKPMETDDKPPNMVIVEVRPNVQKLHLKFI